MLPERQSPAAGAQKGRVRLVLFHDENGKVLVLVPARRLLNLASLWSLTGRHLRTVRPEDAARFFGQNGLQSEAGQKRLMESLPLVIDQCLRGEPSCRCMNCSAGCSSSGARYRRMVSS